MNIQKTICAGVLAFLALPAQAANHQPDTQAEFVFDGVELNISTGFAGAPTYAARFAALTPNCTPTCIGAETVGTDVETLTEPDVLKFLANAVGQNNGLLVDARTPSDRAMGFIPGSVSLPFETVDPTNEFRDEILKALGARAFEDVFNFTDAQSLVVYDSGPTRNDAEILIMHLLEAGYPADKIRYYRGGMQVWAVLGLTIQE